MKIIDLLNKISNGEEVPKEIKYNACLFAFKRQSQDYYCEEYGNLFEYLINEYRTGEFLNYEVEIIEEDKTIEPKPITKKDLEAIGYAFGEMKKALQNGWDKSLKNEPFKEYKKIEKFDPCLGGIMSFDSVENIFETYKDKINEIIDKVNKERE